MLFFKTLKEWHFELQESLTTLILYAYQVIILNKVDITLPEFSVYPFDTESCTITRKKSVGKSV